MARSGPWKHILTLLSWDHKLADAAIFSLPEHDLPALTASPAGEREACPSLVSRLGELLRNKRPDHPRGIRPFRITVRLPGGATAPGVPEPVDFTQGRDQAAAFSIVGNIGCVTGAALHLARLAGFCADPLAPAHGRLPPVPRRYDMVHGAVYDQ